MKKILITGGAGFIGSHLSKKILKNGNHVTVLDNLHTGKKINISELLDLKNFIFIEGNVQNELNFDNDFDEIYNLACPASPISYQKNSIETMKTNILGSMNLLDFSRLNNSKIFQASTSEVYGDPLVSPQHEEYLGNVNAFGIRACYDEGKRAAETLFHDYLMTYGIRIKIARIFNTYGPNMDPKDGRVVSNFIVRALSNKNLEIYGDGTQTRSFCFIDDLIEGFLKLMDSDDKIFSPINLGNPNEFSILDLAKKVIDLTNSSSKINFLPLPSDDPKLRCPDISKAEKLLNWVPEIQLEEGLKRTISYFDKIT